VKYAKLASIASPRPNCVIGAIDVGWQTPIEQAPPAQPWPHAPQLFGSLPLTSMQPAEHCMVPPGQPQAPPLQISPATVHAAQAWPPMPHPGGTEKDWLPYGTQLVPLQQPVQPLVVSQTQWPPEQRWPAAHAIPHAPQFCGSVWVSVHVVPQGSGVVPPQFEVHVERAHRGAAPVQATPHAPQLCVSFGTHAPSHSRPEQGAAASASSGGAPTSLASLASEASEASPGSEVYAPSPSSPVSWGGEASASPAVTSGALVASAPASALPVVASREPPSAAASCPPPSPAVALSADPSSVSGD
jgi:hypothetical protein